MRRRIPGPQRHARSQTTCLPLAAELASFPTATDTDSREPLIAEAGCDLVRFTLTYREPGQPFAVTGGR